MKHWLCMIGSHLWRFWTVNGDTDYRECTRCGERQARYWGGEYGDLSQGAWWGKP